jgi:Zn-dependent peptidase ImmA (M78 family)
MTIRRKLIRAKVNSLLQGIDQESRKVPIEQIVRSSGLRIERQDVDEGMAGFLVCGKGLAEPLVGVNSHHPEARQRFTLAHELGHFVLHNVEGIHVDQKFTVKLRSGLSSQGTDVEEMEANLFAAELLMPEAWLKTDVNNLEPFDVEGEPKGNDVVKQLASLYGVSAQAMGIRLSTLGFLTI